MRITGIVLWALAATIAYGDSNGGASGSSRPGNGTYTGYAESRTPISSVRSTHLPPRIIVGIAVASASFAILVLVSAWLCLRRRHCKGRNEAEMPATQAMADDLAGESPIQQFSTAAGHFLPSQEDTGGDGDCFVAEHRGSLDVISPPLAELEGKEICEVPSPAVVSPAAFEMPSEKSQLFYNGYALAQKRFKEEALRV
ncbi:hypothetical protein OIDMADRAFT_181229 [Oidiodendron maius Zn]|uniref:Uncharacterized protein n=1 Tax=Oidiodendron maius (strain Zn) TaxID=913774 RepID=A0A0C3H9J5_OIDMZ|nr:hypothetical protein OIDMADRAFT_181229 [Oidiodendron maius Zn]